MSFAKHLSTEIASYRLGYAPQRPYPWRWTTPIVLCAFLFISGLLAAINVPLSAYEVVQEVTYRPNDTLPPLPLSYLVPAILQHPASSFTPQILTVGNTLTPNNSVFNFTIVEAYNELDNSNRLSTHFPAPSAPFVPEGGDGWVLLNGVVLLLSVDITCHIPTLFEMTWTSICDTADTPGECSLLPVGNNPVQDVFNDIVSDLVVPFMRTNFSNSDHLAKLGVTVQPCCDCNTTSPGDSPTQAPCSLLPARLTASQISIVSSYGDGIDGQAANTTDDLFGDLPYLFWDLPNYPGDSLQDIPLQGLTALFQNTSPVMFNHTISDVYLRLPRSQGLYWDEYSANKLRSSTTNATLMSEWANTVQFFNDSENVPVINYLRTVPRLKPLGAAITSVFVSTFAMLSTLWTVFSLVAGVLATLHEGKFHSHRFI
ncbi:hypothetical protein B0H14DRAFT_3036724 [Mycena olivaceomarginata]|nr:hypothetical protein B0H14DRAFT_3036724 [Mycena olivaceomarginata]